jgi:hypothetical protein
MGYHDPQPIEHFLGEVYSKNELRNIAHQRLKRRAALALEDHNTHRSNMRHLEKLF